MHGVQGPRVSVVNGCAAERELEDDAFVVAAGYALLHHTCLRLAPRRIRSLTSHGILPLVSADQVRSVALLGASFSEF